VRSLGLDLGGTNIKLVVVEDGRVVDRAEAPTLSEEGAAAVLERMAELVRGAGHVGSVGVALPGLFDADGVAVLLPNLHGDWTGRAIREPLERSLDSRVSLINDGHAFALAEATFGAGRGGGNVMCVVCGTGIGGGLVLDGRLHLGPEQRAGEFGHHTVVEDGPLCECGNHGCLELYAGARRIAAAARAVSFDDVVARVRVGDAQAAAALERAGTLVGLEIANVLIFVCPDRVVVGGGVAAAGDAFLGPLRDSVADRARVAPLDRIAIEAAELGPHAGAIGAALWGAAA
jgi:glucokinase